MSLDAEVRAGSRLLSASLESTLAGWLRRGIGLALVTGGGLVWLALITWSFNDPSLSHATSSPARNLLGASGAVAADLLIQALGFAANVVLMFPIFWGLRLAGNETIPGLKVKILTALVALAAIAGGLSALPTPEHWPLHYGYGGGLGDLLLGLGISVVAGLGVPAPALVFGLASFALGFWAVMVALGVDRRELMASVGRSRRGPMWSGQMPNLGAVHERDLGPDLGSAMADDDDGSVEPADPVLARAGARADARTGAFEFAGPEPALPIDVAEPAGVDVDEAWMRRPIGDMDDLFDAATDAESRSIAARFAPRVDGGAPASAVASVPTSSPATGADPAGSAAPSEPGGIKAMAARLVQPRKKSPARAYRAPSLNLLARPMVRKAGGDLNQTALRGNARLLEDVLADFGIKGDVRDAKPGPVVTLYELEPQRGIKASRVIGLADDIARSMSAQSARVALIPGRNVIGIELPNVKREGVQLREILDADDFKSGELTLPVALGKAIDGTPVVADLARMPHLLVAGTTGSGKSVGINAMILSLVYRHSPEQCRMVMIDPKMLELSVYNGIPHLLTPVVTDPQKAISVLNWAVREMEERYKRMSDLGVRNIEVFNNRVRNARKHGEALSRTVQTGFDPETDAAVYERRTLDLEPLPYIVIVVDEFADLMIVAGKEIEAAIQRLAQMARAAGIHLIMATQRPSVDIVTGIIKANFPSRISFKVASKIDSRTILNEQGAEQLLGQGDMLFAGGGGQMLRVHGAFVSDEEVEAVAEHLRGQGAPAYLDEILEDPPEQRSDGRDAVSGDDLYDRAVALVLRDRKASTSYIQRRLSIGYNRAADLIERMEREGVIGPANHAGKREILDTPRE